MHQNNQADLGRSAPVFRGLMIHIRVLHDGGGSAKSSTCHPRALQGDAHQTRQCRITLPLLARSTVHTLAYLLFLKPLNTPRTNSLFCLARQRYRLLDEEVANAMDRVFPVGGDLARPLLGLSDSAFKVGTDAQRRRPSNGCLVLFLERLETKMRLTIMLSLVCQC